MAVLEPNEFVRDSRCLNLEEAQGQSVSVEYSGAEGTRTPDPLLAKPITRLLAVRIHQ